ncbi:MAG TPA: 23S rRNA (guanosine(2251)-2'-O)-methyltransferase RlmB [Candidatus Kryptonia bacterium]
MADERIVGRNAVAEALRSGSNISKIYILYSAHGGSLNEIYSMAKRAGVPISKVDSKQFAELTSGLQVNESPQGIVASVSQIKYFDLSEIVEVSLKKKYPFLLLLDRIQDPQNFGAILRTASFFGIDGVVISREGQAPLNETAVKASAGGAFHIKIARESNLHQTMTYLKEKGFWIATSVVKSPVTIRELDLKLPLAVLLGNEGSGVRKLLRDKSDFTFSIPQAGRMDSLNVSVATGIICYEIMRQRGGQV